MGSIDIVAVGDSCGKTALLHAMRQTDFKIGNELEFINIPPTVYESYQVHFKSHGVYIRVNLHDTAGQDDYDRLRPLVYELGIDVVLLVFSVISPDSFENIEEQWIHEINHFLKNVPRILVGTKSESRDDERILAHLKKMKQMPVKQTDIDVICKRHSLKYFETSALTGYGVETCLYEAVAAGMTFKYGKNNVPYRLKIHVLETARHILRQFVVEKILPVIKKDWATFCVKIGFNKNVITIAKAKRVINPFWQIIRYWTETVEKSYADPSKILYKGLNKVNKSLKRDLLEWIVRDSETYNIQEIKKYLEDKEIHAFDRFKSQLTLFKFSDDEQIPLTIWKMGKAAEEQYREILQSGVENRYMIRLPVVGPFGVGKTCLTRKLLRKQISDVTSTNGIEIMTQKCKVCLTDDTWIFSQDIRFDVNQGRKSRLAKNLLIPHLKGETHYKTKAELSHISSVSEKDVKAANTYSHDQKDQITKISLDEETLGDEMKKKVSRL